MKQEKSPFSAPPRWDKPAFPTVGVGGVTGTAAHTAFNFFFFFFFSQPLIFLFSFAALFLPGLGQLGCTSHSELISFPRQDIPGGLVFRKETVHGGGHR